jgi:hypothetical protein
MKKIIFALSTVTFLLQAGDSKIGFDLSKPHKSFVVGPEELILNQNIFIEAERVVLNGKIVTNGFEFRVRTRILEYTETALIQAFNKPADPVGIQAQKKPKPPRATGTSQAGADGGDGGTGSVGASGSRAPGRIYISAGIIVGTPKIDGTGETGGDGGTGQDGQDGGQGGPGKSAKTFGGLFRTSRARSGGQGGKGGVGGSGGAGGTGGAPVDIFIHYGKFLVRDPITQMLVEDDLDKRAKEKILSGPGIGGQGGRPGENGSGGTGGEGGGSRPEMFGPRTKVGERGAQGPEQDKVAELAAQGKNGEEKPKTIRINSSYEQIMDAYVEAELVADLENYLKKFDEFARDLKRVAKNPKLELGLEETKKRLSSYRYRYDQMKEFAISVPLNGDDKILESLKGTLNRAGDYLKKISDLFNSWEKSPESFQESDEALAEVAKQSGAVMDEMTARSAESMKEIARRIYDQKNKFQNHEFESLLLDSYALFGPKQLEDWSQGEAPLNGSREEIVILKPKKSIIYGLDPNYPIKAEEGLPSTLPLLKLPEVLQ